MSENECYLLRWDCCLKCRWGRMVSDSNPVNCIIVALVFPCSFALPFSQHDTYLFAHLALSLDQVWPCLPCSLHFPTYLNHSFTYRCLFIEWNHNDVELNAISRHSYCSSFARFCVLFFFPTRTFYLPLNLTYSILLVFFNETCNCLCMCLCMYACMCAFPFLYSSSLIPLSLLSTSLSFCYSSYTKFATTHFYFFFLFCHLIYSCLLYVFFLAIIQRLSADNYLIVFFLLPFYFGPPALGDLISLAFSSPTNFWSFTSIFLLSFYFSAFLLFLLLSLFFFFVSFTSSSLSFYFPSSYFLNYL